MTIFYTGSDIEELAASGVTQLEIGPGIAITDVAREMAEELGIELVTPGMARQPAAPRPVQTAGAFTGKPRGCQHGPLSSGTLPQSVHSVHSKQGNANSGVVDELVDIISRLKGQGG